jgi:hypothetical protein
MSIPNDFWIKGGAAMLLPYRDQAGGFYYDNLANNPDGRTACGYTKAPDWPDFDPTTQEPIWQGGGWVLFNLPAPSPPLRPELPKSVVIKRLISIGKISAAMTAIMANPAFFALWTAPDWPNVYCDDADLLTLLHGIGCTDAEIATVTAA